MSRFLPLLLVACMFIIIVESKQESRRFLWDMMKFFVDPQHRCLECYNCNCHWKQHPTECSGWSPDCVVIVDHQNCSIPYHYDGAWSQWGSWSNCTGHCGPDGGVHIRFRYCNNPSPHNCGKTCHGHSVETHHCDPCSNATVAPQALTTAPTTVAPTHPQSTVPAWMPTVCNKFCAIGRVASNNSYTHPDASACLDGSRSGPEALPLVCCIVPPVSTWKVGVNVMSNCHNTPMYTPVAIFTFGHYVTGTVGIFAGCLDNGQHGFKMALQRCGQTPTVENVITSGTVDGHPDAYFTIQ